MADFGISEGIALAGVVATVATTAASAVAASNIAKYNQNVANNDTAATQVQTNYENQLKQIQLEKTLGTEQAYAAAGGVEGGSEQNISYNSLVMGKMDQLATTYQGQIAEGRDEDQAALAGYQGSNAVTSDVIGGLGSAAGGAAKAYSYGSSSSGVGAQPDYSYGDYMYDGYMSAPQ